MEKYFNSLNGYDFSDIPGSEDWIGLTEILEGNSSDRKFKIKTSNKDRYFLRIADCTAYDRKKNEYENMMEIKQSGFSVPDPVGFGICNHGKSVYLQTRWIYGVPGEERLLNLGMYHQYYLGTEAGVCLKAVHCLKHLQVPSTYSARYRMKVNKLADSCVNYRKPSASEQKLIEFVKTKGDIIEGRPCRLLHGDFNTGNIMLSYEDTFSLIDFDNWQYGDPLSDLANVFTCIRQVNVPYATGILDTYFGFNITDNEMQLMKYYAAVGLLERLSSARKQGEDAMLPVIDAIKLFQKDFQQSKTIEPSWYKRIHVSDKTVLL